MFKNIPEETAAAIFRVYQ